MEKDSFNTSWKKYEDNISLCKYYFDLSLKIIVWYSGVVGAIFAFFVAYQSLKYITLILIIPIFLSLLLFILSASSIIFFHTIEKELRELSKKVETKSYPTAIALIWIMQWCSIIFIGVTIGLSIIFLNNIFIPV